MALLNIDTVNIAATPDPVSGWYSRYATGTNSTSMYGYNLVDRRIGSNNYPNNMFADTYVTAVSIPIPANVSPTVIKLRIDVGHVLNSSEKELIEVYKNYFSTSNQSNAVIRDRASANLVTVAAVDGNFVELTLNNSYILAYVANRPANSWLSGLGIWYRDTATLVLNTSTSSLILS